MDSLQLHFFYDLYFIKLKRLDKDELNEEMNDIEVKEHDEERKETKKVRFDLEESKETEIERQDKKSMDINVAHRRWGHPGKSRMKELAMIANVTLVGTFEQCDACGVSKVKCNPIAKTTMSPATKVGERLFIDTSGPFPRSLGSNKYVRGIVDDYSGYMFTDFGKGKDGMLEYVEKIIKQLKGRGTPCSYIRCDNAGEHVGLQDLCSEHGITIEYTPPYSPEYNGRIERRFAVVIQRSIAMMFDAGFSKESREMLWAEAFKTAAFLGDIFPTARNNQSAYGLFFGKKCPWYEHLIEYGRIGMITTRQKGKKLEPQGEPMIMVGYALTHKPGSYRMYNPRTKRIIVCDNIMWSETKKWKAKDDMKHLFDDNEENEGVDEKYNKVPEVTPIVVEDELDKTGVAENNNNNNQVNQYTQKARRMLKELETSYNDINDVRVTGDTAVNPVGIITRSRANRVQESNYTAIEPYAVYESTNEGGERVIQQFHFCFNTAIQSDPGEPKTFKQAMQSEDWEMWSKAIKAEINNFLSRDAWQFVKRAEVKAKGRRLIPTKHVFKRKIELDPSTGKEYIRYKDRIVTLGFMQIPGVDYTESFSPVVTDTGLRLVFAIVLFFHHKGWECHCYDVEAAFLQPKIDDLEMYIELPPGLQELGFMTEAEAKDYCIKLQNSMYGNVDAALRWIIMKTEYLTSKEVGMIQSRADPCIFFMRDEYGEPILIVAMTVDDCAVGGNPACIKWLMDKIESRFKITRGGKIRKHLGVDYKWKIDNNGEPFIEAWMERKREDIVKSYEQMERITCKVRKTPAAPGSVLKKSNDKPVRIENYRSMVGKVMFYGTKVCPKIVNICRELATHMGCPNEEHWKAMGHLVGYIKGTIGSPAMIYRKPKELRCVSFVDASYGNSDDGRRSVSGELHTVGGMITSFCSRTQKTISMSSAESEYIAASSAAQEMMFEQMLLSEICETVLPGVIFEDNEGAIFLSKNKQVSQRTKHIDLRYHFLREFTDKGNGQAGQGILLKVNGKENYADLMTKNTDGSTFEYLGKDIDVGLKRFRDEVYDGSIIQQLGGMSSVMKYKVGNDTAMYGQWMKVVRRKGKLRYERDDEMN